MGISETVSDNSLLKTKRGHSNVSLLELTYNFRQNFPMQIALKQISNDRECTR
jgi:hypothetical protein